MSIKYFFCLKCINLYLQHYCPLIPECNKHAPNRYCRARKSETTTDTSCRKNLPHSVVSPDKILLLKLHQWQALLSATDSQLLEASTLLPWTPWQQTHPYGGKEQNIPLKLHHAMNAKRYKASLCNELLNSQEKPPYSANSSQLE